MTKLLPTFDIWCNQQRERGAFGIIMVDFKRHYLECIGTGTWPGYYRMDQDNDNQANQTST